MYFSLLINNLYHHHATLGPLENRLLMATKSDKNFQHHKGSEKMGKFSNFLLRNFYYFCSVKMQ